MAACSRACLHICQEVTAHAKMGLLACQGRVGLSLSLSLCLSLSFALSLSLSLSAVLLVLVQPCLALCPRRAEAPSPPSPITSKRAMKTAPRGEMYVHTHT